MAGNWLTHVIARLYSKASGSGPLVETSGLWQGVFEGGWVMNCNLEVELTVMIFLETLTSGPAQTGLG